MNFNTRDNAEESPLNVICSGILKKDGEKIVYVRFERGDDYAEGSVPAAKITSRHGFTEEDVAQFEAYLAENGAAIVERAKSVNLMKNFLK